MAASTVMTVAAITAATAAAAGAVVEGIQANEVGKFKEAEAKINAAQAAQAQKQAYQESSLNASQTYRAGRHDIAAAANMMSGMGNVGTSAQTSLFEGAFNLSEDLSALKYKYDAQAANYETQGNMYRANAKMADYNRKMGILAASIKTTGAVAAGVYGYGNLHGWGAGASAAGGAGAKSVVDSSGNVIGEVGGYGSYMPETTNSLSDMMPWRYEP